MSLIRFVSAGFLDKVGFIRYPRKGWFYQVSLIGLVSSGFLDSIGFIRFA